MTAQAAHRHERLRLVMAMRRHEMLLGLLEMAWAQAAQEEEEQQLALAMRRSLEPQGSTDVASAAPPPNSLAHLDDALPAMSFVDAVGFLLVGEDGEEHECAVCLMSLQSSDMVRLLPCVHCFHQKCIDKWLQRSAVCPTCKGSVPLS